MSVDMNEGKCSNRFLKPFLECLKCWLKRAHGEPPYHLGSVDLSKNALSDASVTEVCAALDEHQVRVDRILMGDNRIGGSAAS